MADYDAIIIGSGPNGIAAAICLQQKGLSTLIVEGKDKPGGAARTEELTEKGFLHDVGSSIHPLAYDSPFFKNLPLEKFGLEWIFPDIPFAHPFENGEAYACYKSIEETVAQFNGDKDNYLQVFEKLTNNWNQIAPDILSPIGIPRYPLKFIDFGIKAVQSAKFFTRHYLKDDKTRLLFYGAAAHSTLPLSYLFSASFGLVLTALGHHNGWPYPKGGAVAITNALLAYYQSIGGKLMLNKMVSHMDELPASKAYIFDLTPRQLLKIGGTKFTERYRKGLEKFRYGAGIFKIDWALKEQIPFLNEKCRKAGTIHLGYSLNEIEASERLIHKGQMTKKPYVLMAQHSVFDGSRAPKGFHTAWAYCHVPNGSEIDATTFIEDQIEKAAPGFKDCILSRKTHNTYEMEVFDPNLIGGDINGGMQHIAQMFTRPVARLDPYSTPDARVFICSASTPPGGGVHGMGGYNAANSVIKKRFK